VIGREKESRSGLVLFPVSHLGPLVFAPQDICRRWLLPLVSSLPLPLILLLLALVIPFLVLVQQRLDHREVLQENQDQTN
jgi:hypothetical protein